MKSMEILHQDSILMMTSKAIMNTNKFHLIFTIINCRIHKILCMSYLHIFIIIQLILVKFTIILSLGVIIKRLRIFITLLICLAEEAIFNIIKFRVINLLKSAQPEVLPLLQTTLISILTHHTLNKLFSSFLMLDQIILKIHRVVDLFPQVIDIMLIIKQWGANRLEEALSAQQTRVFHLRSMSPLVPQGTPW